VCHYYIPALSFLFFLLISMQYIFPDQQLDGIHLAATWRKTTQKIKLMENILHHVKGCQPDKTHEINGLTGTMQHLRDGFVPGR